MAEDAANASPPPKRFDLARLRREAGTFYWERTSARAGLVCLPAIAAWAFGGLITGHNRWALGAIAGAVTVGFGAFQRLGERRWRPILVTLAGITLATFLGSVAGHYGSVPLTIVAAAWGVGFGALTSIGYGTWWIGLQWTIGLLVYGSHAAGPAEALDLSLGVFLGGVSQLAVLALALPFAGRWFEPQAQPAFNDPDERLFRQLARSAHPATVPGRYALRVAIALGAATALERWWGVPNGYWIPMTAAILLKPDLHETTLRGFNRLAGTLSSAATTTLLLARLQPGPIGLGALLLVAVYTCFVFQRVHYAFFAASITAYVVLLLSLVGLPTHEVVLHRIEATLVGAAIALLVHAVPLPAAAYGERRSSAT